jgi:alpha-tubulin suppressor-like RCC1 family protein
VLGRRAILSLFVALLVSGVPAPARAADAPTLVSAGGDQSCALLSPRGGAMCWGEGIDGQLGDGTSTASPVAIAVSGIAGATAVDAGEQHTCAVVGGGRVACWGNAQAVVEPLHPSVIPEPVGGLSGAVAVSSGSSHNCALLGTGQVECWGLGDAGELGNGRDSNSAAPVAVAGIGSATAVSAGAGFSCAVLADGSVRCWGRGRDGELGNGATADSATPVAVSGVGSAVAVSAGTNHACALLAGGGIACWGSGDHGQLGDGTSTNRSAPVAVSGVTTAVAVAAGGIHTCALLAGGVVQCWGYGGDGQLGLPARDSSATPVANGVGGATGITAGLSHTCALLASGGVQCWGMGDHGELGDGRAVSTATAVNVIGLDTPPPVLGQSTTLQPVSGTVLVKTPGAGGFVPLRSAATLPVGTTIDTDSGRVRLTSAADTAGRTQAGLFYGGAFQTGQKASSPLTELALTEALGCASSSRAVAAKRKKKRRVWGDAKGSFSTKGSYGAATVRGTKWLVEDSCSGTSVQVARGSVRFEDFVRHRTVVVTEGHSYTAGGGGRRQSTRSFTAGVGRLLSGLARGRKRLGSALGGAMTCKVPLATARDRVAGVIANRTSILDQLDSLDPPTKQARTVVARLRTALKHSLAADRHYRDWLDGLASAHARCPLPRGAAFTAAGRDDKRATKAKRQLLSAFNPMARRAHLRTWRANQI